MTARITLSLANDEAATIKALAELAGLSTSAYLRASGLSANGRHVEMIADLEARVDKAERALLEVTLIVDRFADGVS